MFCIANHDLTCYHNSCKCYNTLEVVIDQGLEIVVGCPLSIGNSLVRGKEEKEVGDLLGNRN